MLEKFYEIDTWALKKMRRMKGMTPRMTNLVQLK
jgi:hypothetical protein